MGILFSYVYWKYTLPLKNSQGSKKMWGQDPREEENQERKFQNLEHFSPQDKCQSWKWQMRSWEGEHSSLQSHRLRGISIWVPGLPRRRGSALSVRFWEGVGVMEKQTSHHRSWSSDSSLVSVSGGIKLICPDELSTSAKGIIPGGRKHHPEPEIISNIFQK